MIRAMLLMVAAILGCARPAAAEVFDLVIRHGVVVDGAGGPRYAADVGVTQGVISKIGDLSHDRGRRELDATGLFVAPGFINPHSHADADAVATAVNMLTQGVTTEVINPDGEGATDIRGQLRSFSRKGLAINLGAYVGFNAVWEQVMGPRDHRASAADLQRMRGLVAWNLEAGAWGVSGGLDYKPGYFATAEEVEQVIGAASGWRTNFPNHERLPPPAYSSREGVAETIAIASAAGLTPVITHIKSQGHEQGQAPAMLAAMAAAARSGHYTTGDVYPYLAGLTGLADLLVPAWAQDGGRPAMLSRFQDPSQRAAIAREAEAAMAARLAGGADGVYLPDTGEELTAVAAKLRVSPGEAMVTLLAAKDRPAVLRFGAESDLRAFLTSPVIAITCDCGASLETRTHPRYFGAWPRVLGTYVREQGLLSWEEAVRKMTALPASTLGLVDRGLLAPGMAADITVFDPRLIGDRATYAAPTLPSVGVTYVLVNGHLALDRGKPTGVLGGKVLRRSRAMPTRPMDVGSAAHLRIPHASLANGGSTMDLSLDVSQTPGGDAEGVLSWGAAGQHHRPRAVRFGRVQRARGWMSVTGFLRDPAGTAGGVTLIVDGAAPDSLGSVAIALIVNGRTWAGRAARRQVEGLPPAD